MALEVGDGIGERVLRRPANAPERVGEPGISLSATSARVAAIADQFRQWADDPGIEIIIATGGTGLTGRDVTPEALAEVADKDIPGFGELFRMLSYEKIKTSTIQSRACAGVVGGTYIFAVPGSPGACKDAWDDILVHQLDIRFRPCNFVEMMPRLKE